MAKNKGLWIVLAIIAIMIIGPKLGLFSIELFQINELDSRFVAKAGLISGISDYWMGADSINQYIDKFYAVGIFDGPVKLEDSFRTRIVARMVDINARALTGRERYFFNTPPFSQKLMDTINKPEYTAADLATIFGELDNTANTYCAAVRNYKLANPSDIDVESIVKLCDTKPAKLFTQSGGKWQVASLNDYTWQMCTGGACYIGEGGQPICTIRVCTNETVYLSRIRAEVFEAKGDIFIGVGSKGIAEVEKIDSKYEFAQYAYEIEHAGCSAQTTLDSGGCAAASNSPELLSATNGTIKQSNSVTDLFYGFKYGNDSIFMDKTVWIIGGAILLIVVLLLLKK
jgi:hypothetical protein